RETTSFLNRRQIRPCRQAALPAFSFSEHDLLELLHSHPPRRLSRLRTFICADRLLIIVEQSHCLQHVPLSVKRKSARSSCICAATNLMGEQFKAIGEFFGGEEHIQISFD